MPMQRSVVVITQAQAVDFLRDYVSLPREYGTPAYDMREDVRAIRSAVWENLTQLDERLHFTDRLVGRRVILKPNLVTVFHDLGMRQCDYPETTDPRVLDAVVEYLQRFTQNIVIVESSGRGMPTRASFKIAGLDRLAKFRKVELVALEEQPADRYLLLKAKVMREMVIPRIMSQVVRGEAFYISLPKMKTNLYAGVTLGFKNAMGAITYNLRQRNHNFMLDQKLVDMLHLFKPDLTIIDGIVGGEGNAPAPVEPVQSRVIISGNHSVETDRIATRMMGLDPAQIPLMRLADENGFGDPAVEVIGEQRVTPFRQADPSLLGNWMRENFPNVRVLIGHNLQGTPGPDGAGQYSPEELCALENTCRGGCLAAVRYAFDMLYHEGARRDFHLTLVIGAGVPFNGERMFFDRDGRRFTLAEVQALPGKKAAIGTCAEDLKVGVNRYVPGCMPFPNSAHMVVHQLSGTACSVMGLRNRYLLTGLVETLRTSAKRKSLLRQGVRLDVPLRHENRIYPLRELSATEMQQDWIYEPFASLTANEIKSLCQAEDRAMLATFLG